MVRETARVRDRTHQLREEVGGLRGHAAVHAEALDVFQVGRQLRRVGMDDHIDEHRQEVISPCSTASLVIQSTSA